MTIAACYVSTEGVVLGADSTSTMLVGEKRELRHFNFAQKVFEFGDRGSTVGAVIWGLGSPGKKSWRTLIAEAAEEAYEQQLSTYIEPARLTSRKFWDDYSSTFHENILKSKELRAKGEAATKEEKELLSNLVQKLSGGLCLGGRWGKSRESRAAAIHFNPFLDDAPEPRPLDVGVSYFWGCPNMIRRLIVGIDGQLAAAILNSGKWNGTEQELLDLIRKFVLTPPRDLPLREAVDWMHASIFTTIKAMKFSLLAPVCGGPIEIAVISSDRPFRWICHKEMGEAIDTGRIRKDRSV